MNRRSSRIGPEDIGRRPAYTPGMLRISRKADSFTESVIREMNRLAVAAGAVSLAQGFPDFPCPPELKAAVGGRGRRRPQPVRDHVRGEAAARRDRREDGPLPSRLGRRPGHARSRS